MYVFWKNCLSSMASEILQILITPVTELAKLFVNPLKKQTGYVLKWKINVKNLRNERTRLTEKMNFLSCAIDEAQLRGEAVSKDLKDWLQRVEIVVDNIQKLLGHDDGELGDEGDHEVLCTSFKNRYVLSKRSVKLLKVIDQMKSEFQQLKVPVPILAPPPSIEAMPSGDFEAFETTRLVMDCIMAALSDNNLSVIGVYGMGGVGKTSLIKEVARHAKVRNMFDDVVIVTVSRNLVKIIQRDIAECLGMHLGQKSVHIRSLRLAERLKLDRRTLIILDDVWDRLEFSQIGIPFGEDRSKCKIVITTRNRDVCSEMYCSPSIEVKLLTQEDSWHLFKRAAGDIAESPDLNEVAKEVVGQCGGLPIALVTVGRVLRNKDLRIWEDAAYELRQSRPLNIKGMHEKVFACLKLSFDQLQSEESKLCYLYCSLFPEDYDIQVENLLRYGLGEGLFPDVETVDEARSRVHSIVSNLKASCLLLSGTQEETAKMHEVYRALAISIATSDDYSFMVKANSRLTDWPRKPRLEYVMRMSLINNDFTVFSGQRVCPELLLLLLQNNTTLKTFSDEFFGFMTVLKVLDISNLPSMVALPRSLSFLTGLRTLCIENNNLNDASALCGLTSLEILSLRKSTFGTFSEDMRSLTNLRLLDMTDTQINVIPANIISNFSHLEELYMGGSFDAWEIEQSESQGMANLKEVFSLDHLSTLHIDVRKYDCGTEEITDIRSRLKKFQVHIGGRCEWQTPFDRSVCFKRSERMPLVKPSTTWVKKLLQATQQLCFHEWKDLSSLEQLQHDDCQSVKELVFRQCGFRAGHSTMFIEKFKSLQKLQIISCAEEDAPRLTTFWRCVTLPVFFRSLRHLKVDICPKLKTLFSLSMAEQLTQLQQLEISNCDDMEVLIYSETREMSDDRTSVQQIVHDTGAALRTIQTHIIFPDLQILKLLHLKNMRNIIQPCFLVDIPALHHITVQSCPSLKKLPVRSNSLQALVELRAERKWFEELEFEDSQVCTLLQNRFTDTST